MNISECINNGWLENWMQNDRIYVHLHMIQMYAKIHCRVFQWNIGTIPRNWAQSSICYGLWCILWPDNFFCTLHCTSLLPFHWLPHIVECIFNYFIWTMDFLLQLLLSDQSIPNDWNCQQFFGFILDMGCFVDERRQRLPKVLITNVIFLLYIVFNFGTASSFFCSCMLVNSMIRLQCEWNLMFWFEWN